jgi:PhzF family phenazine biosynthesis protein
MKLDLYQVDAFAKEVFEGNPAAVIPLEKWLPKKLMQSIAQENNLSETAFFCRSGEVFDLKWFTPNREVKLCGHATLASAFVIFNFFNYKLDKISFKTLSGMLYVEKSDDLIKMDLPSQNPTKCEVPKLLEEGLGVKPEACYFNEDYVAIFKNEKNILSIQPNFQKLKMLNSRGVIITAPGKKHDFVSRAFFPKYTILEDSVTGSAYTKLIPYWFERVGKTTFFSKQVSKRGGELFCKYDERRVYISGSARLYMKGQIHID